MRGKSRTWISTILVVGAALAVISVPTAAGTRRGFGRVLLDHRLRGIAVNEPGYILPRDRDQVAEAVHVRWVLPLLPGIAVVSHEEVVGSCGVGGMAITAWWPGHVEILGDFY